MGTSSRQSATTSLHQTVSASISAHPGRGSDMLWPLVAVATISPVGVVRTPLLLPVPMSIPRRYSLTVTSPQLGLIAGRDHPCGYRRVGGRPSFLDTPAMPAGRSIALSARTPQSKG